ncbi:MAG TPA: hypothetical protein VMU07_01135 [Candidatus Paceibacterota bacterium]|nr:hypothetical protein [Candidatus Paceibacterota bacterium]
MNTNFKKRFWISLSIIVAGFVAGIGGAFYLSGDIQANTAAIVAARATFQSQNNALSHFADLERDAPIAAQYMTAYGTLIPNQYALINFQTSLNAAARAYGVVTTFSFQGNLPTVPPGAIGNAPITLNIQGTLPGIAKFMEYLESKAANSLIHIDSYGISTDQAGNGQFSGQGTIFFQ